MSRIPELARGREAFARQKWREAYRLLSAASQEIPLEPADLERFAAAAYLVGEDAHAIAIWTSAHHDLIDQGCVERAARWGFWLSIHMLTSGEMAQATGWLARSQRLIKDRRVACAEQGYGLVVTGLMAMFQGNADSAGADFSQAVTIAERFGDPDLLALGLLGRGQNLIRSHNTVEGVAQLDEAMLGVTTGEVSPVLAGIVYCAVILTCQSIFDLHRAREWTRQLDSWCASQPDLVPYRGQCLVHRSELLQMQGDWSRALTEVKKARAHLSDRSEAVVGRACYQQGELHRLRGEFDQADEMYREAALIGYEPQPGLSLLRLAQGRPETAAALIRSIVESSGNGSAPGGGASRPKLLGPYVEILIANGDLVTARAMADELTQFAIKIDAPFLFAASTHATGALLLAEGKLKAALALLREAWAIWRELEMPYETSRTRVLIGQASQRLGDDESARMHFDAAHSIFRELGALSELFVLEGLTTTAAPGISALTPRQRQVLQLIAVGMTNPDIARHFGLSERTVDRHVSDILTRLDVPTRAAATAYALAHGLIDPPQTGCFYP